MEAATALREIAASTPGRIIVLLYANGASILKRSRYNVAGPITVISRHKRIASEKSPLPPPPRGDTNNTGSDLASTRLDKV